MTLGKCRGWTLWAWGSRVELWVCTESVRPHRHPEQSVEVMPLFGWAQFYRLKPGEVQRENLEITSKMWWRWFTIPAGWVHGFELKSKRLVFVNLTRGKSPSENFEPA